MEPQAVQMPHMNTKGLTIFLAMSKWRTSLSQAKGGLSVLKEEEIWLAGNEVWEQFSNCKIAHSYVLAYRIAKKVVKHEGDDIFLGSSGGLHSGVGDNFDDAL